MGGTFLLILSLSFSAVLAKHGFGTTEQEWGYETVREGAHMFWWLHYTTTDITIAATKPLVIWLQGGPGGSSTGSGNFGEVGVLNEQLNERKYAWTKTCNLLFVDNPVGTGFSYVDDRSALAMNNQQIAQDFLILLQHFYEQYPAFTETPLYIFGQSYGGKMAAEIGLELYEAQNAGRIASNFQGLGLGDAWISPVDSISTWGSYLLNQGIVDEYGFESIENDARRVTDALARDDYLEAAEQWHNLQETVRYVSSSVNFYNVLTKVRKDFESEHNSFDEEVIARVMNNEVKEALHLERSWVTQSQEVFDALKGDFMRPVTHVVERILNQTDLKVVIYNGQLDLSTDTPGTMKWVDKLHWEGAEKWQSTLHRPMVVDETIEGFTKSIGQLTFHWISRAGAIAPYDNPQAMDFVLKQTIF